MFEIVKIKFEVTTDLSLIIDRYIIDIVNKNGR